ncbi:hypothetical protein GGQ92_000635 [Gracilibacillus halotolerans]|uniref:DUF4064 domain-containing protein n=1 Tax=Gracilibacillus halotolerans TaxID=74386 RepID=A0A841RMD7_9BACI|nr:hypothetical protein [Gracilibacillus halotolerans]MBB6511868.1 hypothetical protein [Gracilibacillus halotolerans]
MKILIKVAGILTILISIAAQLTAFIDDSYTMGNIWFIGVLSGILTIISANKIHTNLKISFLLLIVSTVLGVISIAYLFILPGIINLIALLYLFIKNQPNNI